MTPPESGGVRLEESGDVGWGRRRCIMLHGSESGAEASGAAGGYR